jgi:ligand-binding SRPBCC domain-containing protein
MQYYRDSFIVDAPVDRVFRYYADIRSLQRITPPNMGMRVVQADTPLRRGSVIRFRLRPRGVPFDVKWVSRITEFEENALFEDRQVKGPFDHWVHRHEFRTLPDGRTEITDTIEAGTPLGFLGPLLEGILLGQGIQTLFDHRRRVVRDAFPPPTVPP